MFVNGAELAQQSQRRRTNGAEPTCQQQQWACLEMTRVVAYTDSMLLLVHFEHWL